MAQIAEELPEVRVAERSADEKLAELNRDYGVADLAAVSAFLDEHAEVSTFLLEIAPQLRLCFGAEAELRLRFSAGDFGDDILYTVVMWPGEVDAVRSALDRFDEWWAGKVDAARQFVCVTYELV